MKTLKVICAALALVVATESVSAQTSDYWQTQRKGANWFNTYPTKQWLKDADAAGIRLVRLAPDKWKGADRDFLIGNADKFDGIPPADLHQLLQLLGWADSLHIGIVLVPLSLPGARWRQNNGDRIDLRLWRDTSYRRQAVAFWSELSAALKGTPAVVGYDILNEPIPEKTTGLPEDRRDYDRWYDSVKGGAADLNQFYADIVQAIRKNDSSIPIIIESGNFADPKAISYLTPLPDSNVLYSVHMYEPWDYTNFKANGGSISYSSVYNHDSVEKGFQVTTFHLTQYLGSVVQWQKRYKVPSNQIYVGEFGCNRRNAGVSEYLHDLITEFNRQGWHWTYYSFREDLWDGMDYEMGDRPAGAAYWEAIEQGKVPTPKRFDNPIWRVLSKEFKDAGKK